MNVIEFSMDHKDKYIDMIQKLWNDIELEEINQIIDEHILSKNIIFLMEYKGDIIGFANTSIRSDYVEGSTSSPVGYIEGIFVEKKYRKQKVASKLVDQLSTYFKSIGITELGSDTEYENQTSALFHKSMGFSESIIRTYIKKI